MMELTVLGTGNAHATEVYNTCYVISEKKRATEARHFLVDGGGGNQILARLKQAGIPRQDCRDIFLTHKHIDHFFGVIWLVRALAQDMLAGRMEGDVSLYSHSEGIELIRNISNLLLQSKQSALLGEEKTGRIHLIPVEDGEIREILGREITFFDIGSTKARQFGYRFALTEGETVCCCGDEPCQKRQESYARDAKWLFHEAFCLYEDREIHRPYEKNHSTVRDAAELAERLGVRNLLLYHTEDTDVWNRKIRYTQEAAKYYHGRIVVPDDLEVISL